MTVLQLTRDSCDADDEVRAPHVIAVRLAHEAVLSDLGQWLVDGDYLPRLGAGSSWLLRLTSRAGAAVALVRHEPDGSRSLDWLGDRHLALRGIGSLHLEHHHSDAPS